MLAVHRPARDPAPQAGRARAPGAAAIAAPRPTPGARGALLAAVATLTAAVLAGCAVSPDGPRPNRTPQRDGPPASPPPDLAATPDAEPRIEPVRSGGPNKPYMVLGESYTPQTGDPEVHERGLASWYGNKFHGRRTASGEVYNMYAMTAAHRTLPIPSYARVRNPANGREVIVRINDRGPFHRERIIDLSYTAALKLGVLGGVATVEVERLTFEQIRTGSWRRSADPAAEPRALAQAADAASLARATGTALPAAAPLATATPARPPAAVTAAAPTEPLLRDPPPAALPDAPGPAPAAAGTPTASPPRTAAQAVPDDPPDRGRAYTDAAEGWWLQLGAFRRLDGAEALRQKVAGDLATLAPMLTVFNEARLYRLQAGPYASRSEARLAAARLRDALDLAPVIVERR